MLIYGTGNQVTEEGDDLNEEFEIEEDLDEALAGEEDAGEEEVDELPADDAS